MLWQEWKAHGGSPGEALMGWPWKWHRLPLPFHYVEPGHVGSHSFKEVPKRSVQCVGDQLACLCHTYQSLKVTPQLSVIGILAAVLIWCCIEIWGLQILAFWSVMKERGVSWFKGSRPETMSLIWWARQYLYTSFHFWGEQYGYCGLACGPWTLAIGLQVTSLSFLAMWPWTSC